MKHFALIVGTILALILPAGLALAHGDASVKVSPVMANPGDSITLIGGDLASNVPVTLHLIGADGKQLDLGNANTDDDGAFTSSVTLPAGLGMGVYEVHATADDDTVVAKLGIGMDPSQDTAEHGGNMDMNNGTMDDAGSGG